ncbi:hypothetical protein ACRTAH_002234 [Clostridium perfringens]
MNKLEMSKTIIENHSNYIKELNLEDKLEKFKNNPKIKVISDSILRKEHEELVNYIIGQLKKLKENKDNLFIEKPKGLAKHINNVNNIAPTISKALQEKPKEFEAYSKKIIEILSYEKFSGNKINNLSKGESISTLNFNKKKEILSGKWSAYRYVFELGIKVCPYCNRQYISPLYSKDGKMRADLDHFFSKSKYPYLSMSIYNLVPSCKFCNSSFKGNKEFSYEENLNPFENNVSEFLEFEIIPKSYQSFYGNDDFEIVLSDKNIDDKENNQKARNNCNIFKIEELYQYHTDIVKNILIKKMLYSDEYIKKAYKRYNILNLEESEYILLSPYIDKDNLDKPLSMLINDIINKL